MIHGDHDDLVWLAGLLEGEGTFDLHKERYPRIRVAMSDRDVVGRAASLMGASIRMSIGTHHKTMYHSEITGARASEIMLELLPYMGARRSSKIGEVLGGAVAATGTAPHHFPGPALIRPPGFHEPMSA